MKRATDLRGFCFANGNVLQTGMILLRIFFDTNKSMLKIWTKSELLNFHATVFLMQW